MQLIRVFFDAMIRLQWAMFEWQLCFGLWVQWHGELCVWFRLYSHFTRCLL